jgi:hypothetical protein
VAAGEVQKALKRDRHLVTDLRASLAALEAGPGSAGEQRGEERAIWHTVRDLSWRLGVRRLCVLVLLVAVGCASAEPATQEERDYIAKVMREPTDPGGNRFISSATTFTVPTSGAPEAWARAQSFVAKYSSMKIQLVNDFLIDTYNPSKVTLAFNYGYNVVKTPMPGDKVEIVVSCTHNQGLLSSDNAARNAKILAHYMKTGELNPRFITR